MNAPREWRPTTVVIDVPSTSLGGVHALLNGQELPVVAARIRGALVVQAQWPRTGAGSYVLEVIAPGDRTRMVVKVAAAKLSEQDHEALIDELERRLPANLAVALHALGANLGVETLLLREVTFEEEVVRLRHSALGEGARLGLLRTLPAIARGPHHLLMSDSRWVAADQARRIDPGRLHQAYARPHAHEPSDEGALPAFVPERAAVESFDTYENRVVRHYCDLVVRRLDRVALEAGRRGRKTLGKELSALAGRLRAAQDQAAFLHDVAPLTEPPTRGTPALLGRRHYRDAFEGLAELNKGFVARLHQPDADVDLTDVPALYEAWGTLLVAAAAIEAGAGLELELVSSNVATRRDREIWVQLLKRGAAAVRLRDPRGPAVVTITPQRRFEPNGKALRSTSFVQLPDVAVELTREGRHALWLFDPKYKLVGALDADSARPVKQDIDRMHAYRDAIRDERDAMVVEHAAILYPGPSQSYGTGISAYEALPTRGVELQASIRANLESAWRQHL